MGLLKKDSEGIISASELVRYLLLTCYFGFNPSLNFIFWGFRHNISGDVSFPHAAHSYFFNLGQISCFIEAVGVQRISRSLIKLYPAGK